MPFAGAAGGAGSIKREAEVAARDPKAPLRARVVLRPGSAPSSGAAGGTAAGPATSATGGAAAAATPRGSDQGEGAGEQVAAVAVKADARERAKALLAAQVGASLVATWCAILSSTAMQRYHIASTGCRGLSSATGALPCLCSAVWNTPAA